MASLTETTDANYEVEVLKTAAKEHEGEAWVDFLIQLIGVPDYKLKVEAWEMLNSFQEPYDLLKESGWVLLCRGKGVAGKIISP